MREGSLLFINMMTKEKAIFHLRRFRRDEQSILESIEKSSYRRTMVCELIDRIRKSDDDPIKVLRAFYYEMDDLLATSESPTMWVLASTLENLCGDALRYLREVDEK